jgi:hypothetical protein
MAVLNRIFCLNTIDGYEIQPELVSWVKENKKYLWAPGTHIYSHIPPRGLNVPCVGLENSDFNKKNFPDSDLYLTAATPKMLSQVVGKLVPGKKLLVYSCKGAELEDTIPHLPLTYLARVYIENGIDSVYLFEKI